MPSGKVASGAAARHYAANRVPSGLSIGRSLPMLSHVCSSLSLIADGARNGHCFTRRCGWYRLTECSMSPDALVLTILSVIPRRVIPGVAARLRLGLRALRRRPFDHRRYSLMLRGYL